jgi:hypothetical protein
VAYALENGQGINRGRREREEMKPGKILNWLFILAIVVAILATCIIQIHKFNPFHSN